MLILGIETSCDDTAVAVLEAARGELRVLSNIVSSQIKLHAPFGGVVPTLAAREHEKNLPLVLSEALHVSGFKIQAIDLLAVTSGPGLIMSLVKGVDFAKKLAEKYGKPLIGINHIEGHIASNWLPIGEMPHGDLPKTDERVFPSLCLVVSGGHTELILMRGHGEYELIGRTLDDAAGEAFDKIARILELGYPGGPQIAQQAAKLDSLSPKLKIELPRPMMHSKNFNFSFSGLKTAVLYLVEDLTGSKKTKRKLVKKSAMLTLESIRPVIAFEAQAAMVDVLVLKTIRAAEKLKVKSILLAGGVSANTRLRQRLREASTEMAIPLFVPPLAYTTDNAAMIACAAYFKTNKGIKLPRIDAGSRVKANANWEIAR